MLARKLMLGVLLTIFPISAYAADTSAISAPSFSLRPAKIDADTAFLESLGLNTMSQTLLVGANTFGVVQFVQPGMMILPNTKIGIEIARGVSDLYGDGRSMDGFGIDVDLVFRDEAAHSADGVLWLARQIARDPERFSTGYR